MDYVVFMAYVFSSCFKPTTLLCCDYPFQAYSSIGVVTARLCAVLSGSFTSPFNESEHK